LTRAPRPTVLSVDDEAGIREAICLDLENDFDVVTAEGGPEALELLARHHVDAVLLDLRLGAMDGEEVLRRLPTTRPRPPVIVVTVVREPKTVVECIKLGAADYVTKPWERGELVTAIRRSLREVEAVPGVLLVSDDLAALVPVQLALESHVRVVTMSVAAAAESNFPALVMVLHLSNHAAISALGGLPGRFPRAAVIWVSDYASGPQDGDQGFLTPRNRLDLTLDRINKLLGDYTMPRRQLPGTVMAAVDVMVRHCSAPLTIAEIANEVGASDDHLTRVFREVFGLPAGSYYTRLRIAVACRLLQQTGEKMEDVASQVGYSGAANLSRAFKEVTGVRPGEFRRRQLGRD